MNFNKFMFKICIVCFLHCEICIAYDNLLLGRRPYDFFPPIYLPIFNGTLQLQAVTDGNDNICLTTRTTTETAYFRIDMSRPYPIKNVRIAFRQGHINRLTPFRIFVSESPNVEETLCYEWTDTTRLPNDTGTYPCNAAGRYLHITSNRGNITVPHTWRDDEPFSSMSFCELSIEGCLEYGRFGTNCERVCNCRTFTCDHVTGVCPGGECADGWTGTTCSERANNLSTSTVSGARPDTGNRQLLTETKTVGIGAIVAIVMVTASLVIVIGLIIIVGISLFKDRDVKDDCKQLVEED